MTDSHRLIVMPHVRAVVNEDGAILLDTQSGAMFSVNAIGGLMWKYVAQGYSRDEIARSIAAECSAQQEQVGTDLDQFLRELELNSLLGRIP